MVVKVEFDLIEDCEDVLREIGHDCDDVSPDDLKVCGKAPYFWSGASAWYRLDEFSETAIEQSLDTDTGWTYFDLDFGAEDPFEEDNQTKEG